MTTTADTPATVPAPRLAPRLAPVRPIRGAIYLAFIYPMIPIIALLWSPRAIASRAGAIEGCKAWCRLVRWTLPRWMGITTEVRGTPPTGDVMIAAKHQSFLDIPLIFGAIPQGRFIMKRELLWAPGLGQYAKRIGCIPVERGKRGAAIKQMLADVEAGRDSGGQLIIYPQGTRTPPGARLPYKGGTAALYAELGQPCVPVAVNVGLFWPRKGARFRPGHAVVEFLDPIPPGLPGPEFLARLEAAVEGASDRLMAEAGFTSDVPTRSDSPRA